MQFMLPTILLPVHSAGTITTQDLGTVMRACGLNPTEAELTIWGNPPYVNPPGTIDWEKFLSLMILKLQVNLSSIHMTWDQV